MNRSRFKWYQRSIGGSGCYIFGTLPLLMLMVTEETPDLFVMTGFLLMSFGVVTFCFGLDRLIRINALRRDGSDLTKGELSHALRLHKTLVVMAIATLIILTLNGVVWVFGEQLQCPTQEFILGQSSKEHCPQAEQAAFKFSAFSFEDAVL